MEDQMKGSLYALISVPFHSDRQGCTHAYVTEPTNPVVGSAAEKGNRVTGSTHRDTIILLKVYPHHLK